MVTINDLGSFALPAMDIMNNRSARIMNKKYTSGKSELLLEVVADFHAVSAEFDSYPSGQELTHVKSCKSRGLVQEVHVV